MKHKKESAFDRYVRSLTADKAAAIAEFLREFDAHNALAHKDATVMREDFERALLYYASIGVPLSEALSRLDIENLGGFYARPPLLWYALDDAAKIYPLSMKHGQMAVFRLSVYLDAPVVPELLQMALTFTIKRFPSFATTVKKGFFWHYLDTAKRRYSIEPDAYIPCGALKVARSGSQSFRVLYYDNRISAEYFHILTDGSGGMVFLKTLTAEYLRLYGAGPVSPGDDVLDINAPAAPGETANEFYRADKTERISGFVDKPSVQLGGKFSRRRPCRMLHFKMDAQKLKTAAAQCGATVTTYILAQMFVACRSATDEVEGFMSIQVPVTMRKFYPSKTLRNFTMYCGVKLPIADITDARSILKEIARQLEEKATRESMSEMMNATERMVEMVRYIPLAIKGPVAKTVYGFLGDRTFCNTLSNLGVVKMPEELFKHILSMDFCLGTTPLNKAACSMVTFNNTATLTIAKMTADPSFEERLYKLLCDEGLEPIVEGSELYES